MDPKPQPKPAPKPPVPLTTDELDTVAGGRRTSVQNAHDKYANVETPG